MSESDEISEAVDAEVRAAVLAAAQLAEQLARRAEAPAREVERDAAAAAAQAERRLAAERGTARAEVAPARQEGWWDTADLDAAARVYATADDWRDLDPQLRRDAERIETRLEERFGPDVRQAVVQAARDVAGDRVQAAAAEARFAAIVAEGTRVAAGQAAAERISSVTGGEIAPGAAAVEPGWDSPARREVLAASLQHVADQEGVDAHGHHARALHAVLHGDVVGLRAPGPATVGGDHVGQDLVVVVDQGPLVGEIADQAAVAGNGELRLLDPVPDAVGQPGLTGA